MTRVTWPPPLWLCADLAHPAADSISARIEAVLGDGPATVWIRHPEALPLRRLVVWLTALQARCEVAGAALWVADRLDVAARVGAHGVHLPGGGVTAREARRWMESVGHAGGVSVPFHAGDDPDCLLGADVALVSPYGAVTGKGPALGTAGLAEGVRRARPAATVALGGITRAEDVTDVLAAGAAGVAVRGLWLDHPDPAAALRPLREALRAVATLRPGPPRANTPRP